MMLDVGPMARNFLWNNVTAHLPFARWEHVKITLPDGEEQIWPANINDVSQNAARNALQKVQDDTKHSKNEWTLNIIAFPQDSEQEKRRAELRAEQSWRNGEKLLADMKKAGIWDESMRKKPHFTNRKFSQSTNSIFNFSGLPLGFQENKYFVNNGSRSD